MSAGTPVEALQAEEVPYSSVVGKLVALSERGGAVVAHFAIRVSTISDPAERRHTAEIIAARLVLLWNAQP